MRNIDNVVLSFIEAIKATEEYKEYICQRERVKGFPELKAQIDEYRHKNYELQSIEDDAFEKIEQFEREYAYVIEDPIAADFLAAELAFCRMMQEINIQVTEAIDFE